MDTNTEIKGHSPHVRTLRTKAAKHADVALKTLAEVAEDKTAPAADRVEAAKKILDAATRGTKP